MHVENRDSEEETETNWTVDYSYDAFDRMVSRQVNEGAVEYFIYDPSSGTEVVLRLEADGDVLNRYLWADAVDQILADESAADGLYWALTDHQGTPRAWANSPGFIETPPQYDVFGTRLAAGYFESLIGWTGRYLDPLTGLQYNWHRWYDPATGKWLSEDSIKRRAGHGEKRSRRPEHRERLLQSGDGGDAPHP